MFVTLFGGLKALSKMLSVQELYSEFLLGLTNLFLNSIKTPGGNNTAIICNRKRVK